MTTYKVIEDRGCGITYDYQTGMSFKEAQELQIEMEFRASKEPELSNGDGESFSYWIIPED